MRGTQGMQAIMKALDQGVAPSLEQIDLSSTGQEIDEVRVRPFSD